MPTWTNLSVTAILGVSQSKSILNKHIQIPASSSFTDVFLRENDLKTVGETASFLWVKVSGSGLVFAIRANHLFFAFLLLIDLLSVLNKLYCKCFVLDIFDVCILKFYALTSWQRTQTPDTHNSQINKWIYVRTHVGFPYLCHGLFKHVFFCVLIYDQDWVSFTSTTCLPRLETQTRHNFLNLTFWLRWTCACECACYYVTSFMVFSTLLYWILSYESNIIVIIIAVNLVNLGSKL